MLSQREQQIWEEIERIHAAEADEVARVHQARAVEDAPAAVIAGVSAVVVGVWVTVVLVVLGSLLVGAVVGLVTALVWLRLRHRDRDGPWSATRVPPRAPDPSVRPAGAGSPDERTERPRPYQNRPEEDL